MRIRSLINNWLNKYPIIKKEILRIYHYCCYAMSKKIRYEGNIIRVSPEDPDHEYFFGYYDKSPWDANMRYMICMKANDTLRDPDPIESADLLLIDTQNNNSIKKIATTKTWNVQQGCMAQWLGPDFSSKIIYNDLRNGKYCSVIMDVGSGEERIIEAPIYTVSVDGKTALTLDFSRLHNLRKGYGYAALPENTKGEEIPKETAIWKIDIESGMISSLLKYGDIVNFEHRQEMIGAVHKVNHLMLSPNGDRFMVLHRWFQGSRKYTRLLTCNIDGTDMYNLSDDDMVSHCYWKNNDEILAFENKHNKGIGYYLMKDRSNDFKRIWEDINFDGHPSYSPTGELIVTDSYPDRTGIAKIMIMREDSKPEVRAKVFSPFKYDGETRCDLHPRWSRDGKYICFDSVFEGHRGLYILKI